MNDGALFLAVFLACVVEAVEATTIVLAAGTARNWRSALTGVGVGIVVLAVAIGVAGPAIALLPFNVLRLVVGGLLLVFGLQWVRKAVLRASGFKALHDEEQIYRTQVAAAKQVAATPRFGVQDWYAFTLSFKGVVLEGLEVVFIVLTFGTNQHNLPLASIAAGVAVILVIALGVAVRAPLARIPENTLKFIVGVMLTSFGVFWGAEGAGAVWPGADTALLVLAPAIAVFALALTWIMRAWRSSRGKREADTVPEENVPSSGGPVPMSSHASAVSGGESTTSVATDTMEDRSTQGSRALAGIKSFGMFWYDFVIGDDWQVAAGIAVAFVITAIVSANTAVAWIVVPIAVVLLLPYSIRRALR
ncbi:MAG: hypothetical protein JWN09_2027 [Microbacteriaceae bacterium]|jgi:uncharacterized membrane protein|nr:hypothetical protein [Microbacteriaceae bacterium]